MKYLKDTGFIVKRVNFGESDRFVTIFSRNNGKIEVIAKGVRKITSRRSSHTELLNLVRFQSVKTSKNYILTEVELVDSFQILKKSLDNIQEVFLICELVNNLCACSEKHSEVFDLICKTIAKIENGEKNVSFDFQKNLLVNLGFWNDEKKFSNEKELRSFIESIIEKKIKTNIFFKI